MAREKTKQVLDKQWAMKLARVAEIVTGALREADLPNDPVGALPELCSRLQSAYTEVCWRCTNTLGQKCFILFVVALTGGSSCSIPWHLGMPPMIAVLVCSCQ